MKWRVLSLMMVTLLAYISILDHDFLYEWDDQWVVINHYTSAGLNVYNLWAVLTEFYQGQYAPFNELSYILVHAVFGYSSMAFHAMSLVWHMANTVLVFLVLRRLLKMIPDNALADQSSHVAWVCALLWGMHPVNVEPVAWISAVLAPRAAVPVAAPEVVRAALAAEWICLGRPEILPETIRSRSLTTPPA